MATKPVTRGFPVREHVGGKYRSGHFTGRIRGETSGGTQDDPMEVIQPDPTSRHPGEPALIHRRKSNLHSV